MMYAEYREPKQFYNYEEPDTWADAPIFPPSHDIWITPTKTDYTSDEPDLDLSPRTSTPEPHADPKEDFVDNSKNPYVSWKDHLCDTPKKTKVRGALFQSNDIISGHLDMRQPEPYPFYEEVNPMPLLNKCFLNLLINGPPPLNYQQLEWQQNWASRCIGMQMPMCHCASSLATNVNLPIGYKYNENGYVVSTVPTARRSNYFQDPVCIYTT